MSISPELLQRLHAGLCSKEEEHQVNFWLHDVSDIQDYMILEDAIGFEREIILQNKTWEGIKNHMRKDKW